MTTKFGRTTPSQMYMLALAGIDDSIDQVELELSDEERISKITWGRRLLQHMTGKDFGFDLVSWRNFLMTNDDNDKFGYKHPYAFENVDKEIQRSISDASQERLITEIKKRGLDKL
ncbi:MAG TPA: hypothetical protein VFQ23_08970 [Anaerolineales bacterium]|nr:hypothetical protein [Anaerolineales bacterium]